jgi:chromosome segregation ATPase
MALAREIGKNLSAFRAPGGLAPKPCAPEPALTQSIAKALGAGSLAEFFRRLPDDGGRDDGQSPPLPGLPRGLDALDWAAGEVDRALAACQRAAEIDPRRQGRQRADLLASKAALLRARQMSDQFRAMIEEWPDQARATLNEALDLAEAAKLLLSGSGTAWEAPGGGEGVSLTALTAGLSESLRLMRDAWGARLGWQTGLRALAGEVEALTATAGQETGLPLNQERFWRPALASLDARLRELEAAHPRLAGEARQRRGQVAAALGALEEGEARIHGRAGTDLIARAEVLASNVETMLRSTLFHCQDLRGCWRALPSLVGRPRFVDKAILSTAVHYGKAIAVGEELRSTLDRFTGRMSSTCDVRAKARKALSVPDRSREFQAMLGRSRRRLATLGRLVLYRARSGVLAGKAEGQARDLDRYRRQDEALGLILESKDEEIRALRERLAEAGPAPGDGPIQVQLQAVEAERDRLEDHLAQARDRLSGLGQFKSQILRSVDRAKEALGKAVADRDELCRGRRDIEAEMASLKRRHARLAQYYVRDRQQMRQMEDKYAELAKNHQVGREEARGYLEERSKLSAAIKEKQSEIDDLREGFRGLQAAKASHEAAIEALRSQEATLRVELTARAEELGEAGQARERLAQLVATLRTQLDRLAMAHGALRESWARRGRLLAESETEKDSLRLRLDRGKRNLISLVTKRQKLLSELGEQRLRLDGFERERQALLEDIERAKAGNLEAVRLGDELSRLKSEMDSDLRPLIQVLALAMWRGQAHLKVVQDSVEQRLGEQRQEFQANEAGLRVAAAAKEIDYLELLSAREKEMSGLKAERDSLAEELDAVQKGTAAKDEDLVRRSWLCQQLSMALSASSLRSERLKRGLRDFRMRLGRQREESEAIKAELTELVQSQSKALADHKAWLGELVPLVQFFMDSGRAIWAGPGREDARDAVLFFMTKENAELAEELEGLKTERQTLTAERQNYVGLNDSIRLRLAELLPLVKFLVNNFVQTTASLAQVSLEREELLRRISLLSGPDAPQPAAAAPAAELLSPGGEDTAPMSPEMASARREINRLARENSRLGQAAAQMDAALGNARAELGRLESGQALLGAKAERAEERLAAAAAETEGLRKEKAELESLLEGQETSLGLSRSEAGRLSLERDQLRAEAKSKDGELSALKSRLEEAETASQAPDGRLEAAWAALTYINSKAGDAMGNLQAKLDKQARELETAFSEMKSRDEAIKGLQERQDRLSLLWWTIFSLASDGQGPPGEQEAEEAGPPAPAPEAPDGGGLEHLDLGSLPPLGDLDAGSLEEPPAEATGPAQEVPGPDGKVAGDLGGSLLAELRKVARKALFTLFLAGLAFFPPRAAGAGEPIELGGPETPMLAEPFVAPATPDLARLSSSYLGRTMDLGVVPTPELALGRRRAEERAREMVGRQAGRWGLDEEAWLRLVRLAYGQETTVNLNDLEGDLAPARLISPHMPVFAEALAKSGLLDGLAPMVLAAVGDFGRAEGPFWERLYLRFRHRLGREPEAVAALAWHLARRSSRRDGPRLEHAGEKAPVHGLENMDPEGAAAFLETYILKNWGRTFARGQTRGTVARPLPKGREPLRLASDLVQTAWLFRIPRTLMVAAIHDAFNASGAWPGTLEIYGLGKRLAGLLYANSIEWSPSKPRLCDFDLLYSELGARARNNGLARCHLRLQAYIQMSLSPRLDLLNRS